MNQLQDARTLISRALQLCDPTMTQIRRIEAIAQEAKELVERKVAHMADVVEVLFGGSFAKGTWLPNNADIDIFVKIRTSVDNEKFEEMGIDIGKKALIKYGPKLRYSDHPYVEAFVRKIRVNVVPCYDVEQGKWKSAADRSPFHTLYMKSQLDDEKRRQARLLKKFFKTLCIYGAELSTAGFSGYVTEVLVLKYGSFENVLQAAADWHEKEVIAVSEYDPDFVNLFNSPIAIIDPVDNRRNLGAAISAESVAKFMLASREFLERPSLEFFSENNSHDKPVHVLLPNVLVVEFSHPRKSPDVLWGQLKRGMNSLSKQLELGHFSVLRRECLTDEITSAAIVFLLDSMKLPSYMKRIGPQVYRRKDSDSFLRNRDNPYAVWVDREMRISLLVDRKTTDARKLVRSLLLNDADKSGVPRNLVGHKVQIYAGDDRKIKGVVKQAVDKVVSTERLVFR
ncbi:MAG TPA: CCA tRNA nucleotidyltransferase [Nitrososphaera sp.]